jgi:arylsulfatase A-like enzyme
MNTPPNVIVFFTDQQRWDTSSLFGNPHDLTPNFDRLAQSGTHLYHMLTPQPVCGPARAVMQTGQYASTNGCVTNGIPLKPESKTLAHYFNEAEYKTGYIGKWHLAKGRAAVPEEDRGGYQYWLGAGALEMTSHPYDTIVYNNDNEEVLLPGYRVDALTDAAIRYIDDNKQNPFYLFLSFLEPHQQNDADDFPAPEGYREKYLNSWMPPDLQALTGNAPANIAGYYGMVKRLDEAFGRLMDCLTSLGLRENTIVLFTSDHGCHFRTRRGEYKRTCHESAVRVPGMLCGGPFEGGGQIRQQVSLVDVAPTLLDAAGIGVPDDMQGKSILPLLNNRRAPWRDAALIQISESCMGRAVRTERWKYAVTAFDVNPKDAPVSPVYQEEFLYDLEHDHYELRNLIDDEKYADVRAGLRQKLTELMIEAGEAAPVIAPAPKDA